MVAIARRNIESAGLEDKIVVSCQEFAHLRPPALEGILVSNLPYGERLSEKNEVGFLYSGVGNILQNKFQGWRSGLLITETDLADKLGIEISESYKLFNGPLVCRLFTGKIKKISQPQIQWYEHDGKELEESKDLFNRLLKNLKKLGKWAEKNSVSCLRIYDRDLPEYNVTIDLYEKWILVQEYAPAKSISEDVAKKRFASALHVVRLLFQVHRDRVFIRQRKRQRGKEQYQKKPGKVKFYEVFEEGCCLSC